MARVNEKTQFYLPPMRIHNFHKWNKPCLASLPSRKASTQGRSDGGISVYMPQNQSLKIILCTNCRR